MDVKQFLIEFKHIISLHDGMSSLREIILSLAFQGNLTRHSNEDASSLLRFLEEQCTKASKTIFSSRKTTFISKPKPLFTIPEHWEWLPIGDIGHDWGQKVPNAEFAYIDVSSIDSKKGLIKEELAIIKPDQKVPSRARKIIRRGTVIYSTVRPYLLNIALVDRGFDHEAIASTAFAIIHPWEGILAKYVYYYLRSPYFIAYVQSIQSGIAYPAINDKKFFSGLIPIPPTAEQKRIVAKVDELMTLCDKLEAQQQEREKLCKITRITILQSLSGAEDSSELEVAWARTNASLNVLLDGEQGLIDLEYALTKLAVRGFLSNSINEHPSLDEIQTECSALKQEYINKGWLRRRKPISSKTYKNGAYPPHWVMAPLDEVAVIIGGITKGHRLRGEDVRSCVYLRVANVQRGFFDLREMKHIEVPTHQFEKYRVEDGDLLITEGGDWDKVGRTAIWAGEVSNCLHQNHIFKARVPSSLLLNEWVELVLNSGIGRDYFAGASKQTTNLASINMTQLRSFPLPIPPIAEQIAILQKVNDLLSICQKLKRQRLDLNDVGQMLASSAVASITGIHIEDKENMKVPKTELVSTLRIGVSPANSERAPLVAILIRNNGEMPAKTLWQASGLEIDAFYQRLKTEMARGWIVQPEVAYIREMEAS